LFDDIIGLDGDVLVMILNRWWEEMGGGEHAYWLLTECDGMDSFNRLQGQDWTKQGIKLLYTLDYQSDSHLNVGYRIQFPSLFGSVDDCLSNRISTTLDVYVSSDTANKTVKAINPLTLPHVSVLICIRSSVPPPFSPATIIQFD
jgi:hypothetical protein